MQNQIRAMKTTKDSNPVLTKSSFESKSRSTTQDLYLNKASPSAKVASRDSFETSLDSQESSVGTLPRLANRLFLNSPDNLADQSVFDPEYLRFKDASNDILE